jgi:hypothetical protein
VINLEIRLEDGTSVMLYDVHPRSQDEAIDLPPGARTVTVWLGVR